MLKILNKILWLIETMLIVIIAITIFVVLHNYFQLKVLKKDYVSFFGHSVFEVISNSMAPTISKKDVIIVNVTDKLKENDIVTYRLGNAFVTHRIIKVNLDTYITKGDANNSKDIPVLKSEVIGKVVYNIEGLGVWKSVLTDSKVLLSVVVTLSLFNFVVFSGDDRSLKKKVKYRDFKISQSGIIEECDGD